MRDVTKKRRKNLRVVENRKRYWLLEVYYLLTIEWSRKSKSHKYSNHFHEMISHEFLQQLTAMQCKLFDVNCYTNNHNLFIQNLLFTRQVHNDYLV